MQNSTIEHKTAGSSTFDARATSHEQICYQLHAVKLKGIACGEEKQPLVLCLHGWLDNAASFSPLMPYLKGKRVIAIDWPGHGMSDHRSADAYYHFIDWVYDLLQLFELNNWQKIDIVGHSMGGMVASAFAAAFPEKVNTLTLVDAIGFICGEGAQATTQLRKGLLSRLKSTNKKKSLHVSQDSAINARLAAGDLNYDSAKVLVQRALVKQDQGYVWRSDNRLRLVSPYRFTPEQGAQLVKDIQIPLQLIYGDKGLDMVSTGIDSFAPMIQNFTSHCLPGGHHVHMDAPLQSAQLINEFILKNSKTQGNRDI
jgi:pimeloyl-ACP methyl ester carboxylesterase